jgi:glycerol uptake facilitator-like aquaporin
MAVVGSGIMAEKLAGENEALALLCNTIATGAVLVVIITIFVSLSGTHFNPAVTLVMTLRGAIDRGAGIGYVAAQVAGGARAQLLRI